MKKYSNVIHHIENLRNRFNLSISEMCYGICTLNEYDRYLESGNVLDLNTIAKFCDKLQISIQDFFYSYNEEDKQDYSKVYELYQMIQERKLKQFYISIQAFQNKQILSKQNKNFFDYCVLKADHITKKQDQEIILNKLIKIIDYPSCLERNAYDFVDVLVLTLITEIETEKNSQKAIHRLIEILHNNDILFVSYNKRHLLSSIYANVTLFLSRLRNYEFCSDFALEGIKYCEKYSDLSSLTLLRYLRSYSLLVLGFQTEAEIEAARCLMTVISRNNQSEIYKYYIVLKKDFNSDPYNFIEKYKQSILDIK